MEYILEMTDIRKEFPGVLALDDIQFKVKPGTVHALMGENGAGKSTLMKIIMGIFKADEGTVLVKGEEAHIVNTKTAFAHGISMIHQELSPVPYMTVSENIWLGREFKKGLFVNHQMMHDKTVELLDHLELDIDPDEKMVNLSVAQTQMVEIAKAISYDSDLIIMDEPTSAITEKEVHHLFKIINELRSKGIAVIYITHKMDEVFEISDEVSVFRDGKYIGTEAAENMTKDKLVNWMVGRDLSQVFHKEDAEIGEVMLEVKNLSSGDRFRGVSFQLRAGEILGIAGLMGAGRSEVVETIFGIRVKTTGEVFVHGKKVNIKAPHDAIKHKIALLTEDRKLSGLFLPLSVKENMEIVSIDKYIKGGFINHSQVLTDCEDQVNKLAIKTPSLYQITDNLSGGNQQKVLISKWLLNAPDILILDEPTRGIDVGAKAEIHKLMTKLVQAGKAVIMISSEMPEVLGMSDRVLVMHEGDLVGELPREEADQEKILMLASGEKLK